jgi:hypothetical protein
LSLIRRGVVGGGETNGSAIEINFQERSLWQNWKLRLVSSLGKWLYKGLDSQIV